MEDFYLAPGSPKDQSDYMVTATALGGKVRALAIRSTASLGGVPLAERSKYAASYHGDIYNPEKDWSTFDLDGWLATHWE